MLTAVDFDREPQGRRKEIEDKIAGRMLPAEIYTELPIAQLLPQSHFDFSIIATKISRPQRLSGRPVKPRG